MEQTFENLIMPLMDEESADDYGLVWEFEKYFEFKKSEMASTD